MFPADGYVQDGQRGEPLGTFSKTHPACGRILSVLSYGDTHPAVSEMTCTRGAGSQSPTAVTVTWTGVEATEYRLTAEAMNGGTAPPPQTGIGKPVSATLVFGWPGNNSGQGIYNLFITAKSPEQTGTPTKIKVELLGKKREDIRCSTS